MPFAEATNSSKRHGNSNLPSSLPCDAGRPAQCGVGDVAVDLFHEFRHRRRHRFEIFHRQFDFRPVDNLTILDGATDGAGFQLEIRRSAPTVGDGAAAPRRNSPLGFCASQPSNMQIPTATIGNAPHNTRTMPPLATKELRITFSIPAWMVEAL